MIEKRQIMKVLLTNAPAFNLKKFSKDFGNTRGYSLYPPISLATLAAPILESVKDSDVQILDLELEILKYYRENKR